MSQAARANSGISSTPDPELAIKEWRLKALTDIWTGDANRRGDTFIPTGLMGSLRWWFEVLVRGLGGKACDPTKDGVRCPTKGKQPHELEHRCVVCELFGCTGWSRKFRLMVVNEEGFPIQRQIKAGQTFVLRFIPLRPIRDEEWCLLNATLRLIADYGAVVGKTVLKPSDEPNRRNAPHHKDYGLVSIVEDPKLPCCSLEKVKAYVRNPRWRTAFKDDSFSWAALSNFWFVEGRHLARLSIQKSTFNKVIGRHEPKSGSEHLHHNNDVNKWLAGDRQKSKKVFSFALSEKGTRTFGFVKPGLVDFAEMEKRLKEVWPSLGEVEFQIGERLLEKLFRSCSAE